MEDELEFLRLACEHAVEHGMVDKEEALRVYETGRKFGHEVIALITHYSNNHDLSAETIVSVLITLAGGIANKNGPRERSARLHTALNLSAHFVELTLSDS